MSAPSSNSTASQAEAASMTPGLPSSYSLQKLLDAPKGQLCHVAGDAFLLQVFWETPSAGAAAKLLDALRACAKATAVNTPATPTYFFRLSAHDTADLCLPPVATVGEHGLLRGAKKKIACGVPLGAVQAEMCKRGLDPAWLDLPESAPLPAVLNERPARVECTELYLDERAFMVHAGSRDYLDSYGRVMDPAFQSATRPLTLRLGTAPSDIVEKVLEPILQEQVAPTVDGAHLWRRPETSDADAPAVFLSLDVSMPADLDAAAGVAAVTASLPAAFRAHCSTLAAFEHPLRERTVRLLCVLPSLPAPQLLAETAAALQASAAGAPALERGEAWLADPTPSATASLRASLSAAGLGLVLVNGSECAGYVLHDRAAQLREVPGPLSLAGDGDQ